MLNTCLSVVMKNYFYIIGKQHYIIAIIKSKIIYKVWWIQNNSKFFILCIYSLVFYHARILGFLPPVTKQCFDHHRLSSIIISPSGQYLALATCLEETARQRHANCARMSLSYLWLRLVSCKKRRQWTRISVVAYTYVVSSVSSAFDGAEGAARLPP